MVKPSNNLQNTCSDLVRGPIMAFYTSVVQIARYSIVTPRSTPIARALHTSTRCYLGTSGTSSCDQTALPVLDMAPFLDPGAPKEARLHEAQKLDSTCREVGFFYIKNHGINPTLSNGIRDVAREFFEMPEKHKELIQMQGGTGRGYQQIGRNITQGKSDWHEAIDFFADVDAIRVQQILATFSDLPPEDLAVHRAIIATPTQFPSQPHRMKEAVEEYVEAMLATGHAVMRMIALGMNLQETIFADTILKDPFWGMRLIGYPELPVGASQAHSTDVGISCGEHCDYGCLTIVNQDNVPGTLQVKRADGSWINADVVDGCFVVNIGDMLSRMTGGVYQSTPHRVVNHGGKYRVSVPFFFEPDYNAVITPIDGGDPADGICYGTHLAGKITNNFTF
eukprot:m.282725 g.282725  ORF g.282725 m.282725 type:complete len:394 (+) comp19862_c0_seq1:241-1422(+)